MAFEIPGQTVTVPAGANLSARQFHFVILNGSGQAILPASTAGIAVFGVLQNKPVSGEAASVMINGLSKLVMAGSTVAVGDLIQASSVGRGEAVTAGAYTVGRVVSGTSGSTGRVYTVAIEPIGTT